MAKPKQTENKDVPITDATPSTANTPDYAPGSDFQVEGQPGAGLRLYQVSAYKKKWMAQAEAQSLGYIWR